MIKQIRIMNYRTCKNVRVSIKEPLMALIGKNAAGKSNTLKGIYAAARQVFSTSQLDIGSPEIGFNGEFVFQHKDEELIYKIKIHGKKERYILDSLHAKSGGESIELFNKKRKVSLQVIGSNTPIFLSAESSGLLFLSRLLLAKEKEPSFMTEPSKHQTRFINVLVSLGNVKYYGIKDQPSLNPIKEEKYKEWVENPHSAHHKNIFSCQYYDFYKNRREDFNEYLSIAKSLGIVRDINVYEPQDNHASKKTGFLFFPFFELNNGLHYFEELSDGTQRVLSLLFHLLYDRSSLMLIEEPESSIHYGLLVKLLSVLHQYTDKKNILIATHSEQILNKLKPEQMIYLSLVNGFTKVKYVTGRNLENIRRYLKEIGPLGEYVTSGELEADLDD